MKAFPIFHPCQIERVNGEYIHHLGNVDYEQVICASCFQQFTFWIDLFKNHICTHKRQNLRDDKHE